MTLEGTSEAPVTQAASTPAAPSAVELLSAPEAPEPAAESTPAPEGEAAAAAPEGTPATEGEKPAEAAPAEEKAEVPGKVAKAFAALTRREREIVLREQQLKAREEKTASLEAKLEAARANPFDLLGEVGWDYNKLTDYVLNDKKPTATMQQDEVRSEVAALKKQLEERERAELQARQQATVTAYKSAVDGFVKENAAKFPTLLAVSEIGGHSPGDTIYATVEAHYNETGRVLTYEEAAGHVESTLREIEGKRLQRLLEIEPFQQYRAPKGAAPANGATERVPGPQANPGPATLTNNLAAAQPPKDARKGPMPREESLRKAAALLMTSDS